MLNGEGGLEVGVATVLEVLEEAHFPLLVVVVEVVGHHPCKVVLVDKLVLMEQEAVEQVEGARPTEQPVELVKVVAEEAESMEQVRLETEEQEVFVVAEEAEGELLKLERLELEGQEVEEKL